MDERTRLLKGSGAPNNGLDAEAAAAASDGGKTSEAMRRREDDDDSGGSQSSRQPSDRRITARQWLILSVLLVATLSSSFAVCLFPPFFPRISEEAGFGASVYGFIIGTNCLTSFLVTPFIGKQLKGRYTYDVHKILGFFDPLSHLCPQNLDCLSAKLGDLWTPRSLSMDVICV